jgi:lipoyl-dependent peroxiredoxin
MSIRNAEATWEGTLREGKGVMQVASGAFEDLPFSFPTRFEDQPGTNPEELVGAALAGCFSMSLSSGLGKNDFKPERIHTTAKVHFGRVDGKARILKIELECQAKVPDVSNEKFQEIAETAKVNCPVSVALTGVEITLTANLS